MSDLFTKTQRQLQNEFNTAPLADRIVDAVVTEELADGQADFIHSRDMFYLATVDETGFPSCSYKGGSTGFVRVLDPQTLVFPNYDGNGMFMSMGNIEAQAKVGLLFIDFERPQRMRLRGTARCLRSGPLLRSSSTLTRAARLFRTCPRPARASHRVARSWSLLRGHHRPALTWSPSVSQSSSL